MGESRNCLNNKRLLYEKYMKNVKGISLTYREVDIISCVVHNRGEKKIASLLNISPRTVSAHIHNIMLKLAKNSRDGITDFIEESGKLRCIRDYYNCILVESLFNKMLTKIQLNKSLETFSYCIENVELNHESKYIINSIKKHLSRINIHLKDDEVCSHRLCLLYDEPKSSPNSDTDIFLLLNRNIDKKNHSDIKYIDFTFDYYLAFFELLKQITKNKTLNNIIKTFVIKCDIVLCSDRAQNLDEEYQTTVLSSISFPKKMFLCIMVISTILVLFWSIDVLTLSRGKKHIASSLKIPKQDTFFSINNKAVVVIWSFQYCLSFSCIC